MLFLKLAGIVAVVFGALYLFAPATVERLNNAVNKVVMDVDAALYRSRVAVGVVLCLLGVGMLVIAFRT